MRKKVLVPLLVVLLVSAAFAEDAKPVIKTGGNFEVQEAKDIAYYDGNDADAEKHKLDLYLPKGQKDFPVLFFVHGGGWRNGDRKNFGRIGNAFATNGIGFVAPSYRLSPKVQHPAHIQDVAKAFAWTVNHIGKHGGNPKEIFLSGHSAGGHLVALLASDDSYLKAEKLSLANIKGVMPVSGVFTIRGGGRSEAIWGKDEELVKKASPMVHVKEKLPPFLMLYADKELGGLGRQAEAFCDALKGAKSDAEVKMMKDRDHGTIMRNVANEDDPTTQLMLEFIAKHSGLKLKAKDAK